MGFLFKSRHIGVAALIMGLSVLLSRFMGLLRDMVIGHFYGAGTESDIYFASFMIPDFINYLLAGGYFSITLIPVLSRCFAKNREDGWRLFSAVFWWVCFLICTFTLVAFIFAPELATLVAPGFSEASQERLAFFLRIIVPAQAFFLPGACLTAILYLRRHFAVPALTPLIYNGCIIIFGLLLIGCGMTGFCVGVLLGAFAGSFLLPLWAVWRGSGVAAPQVEPGKTARLENVSGEEKVSASRSGQKTSDLAGTEQPEPVLSADREDDATGRFNLTFNLFHPELKKIFILALPLMLGQSMVVLDEQFFRIFGSLAGEGGVSLLNYARRLMQVPVGVVAQAAGVASFPFLAQLAASGQCVRFNQTLQGALKNVFAVLAPICVCMILLAQPIIFVIYQHGDFSASDTQAAALLLRIMLAGVIFWGAQQLIGRGFYAMENTLTPAVCGTLVTLIFLPAYYWASVRAGTAGIAGVSVAGVLAYAALLAAAWIRKHGGDALRGTVTHGLSACLLSAAAAAPAGIIFYFLERALGDNISGNLTLMFICGSVFSFFYLMLARLCRPGLLEPLIPFARRLPGKMGKLLGKLLSPPLLRQ
ncbi:MAG: murein biosynthesis integral membrane protein MurJ [Desulfovibrionaceae bacterium]|nr:murein biosynthesis integral membrane protein MurJ [Desulfovibrionaceae bacterium]